MAMQAPPMLAGLLAGLTVVGCSQAEQTDMPGDMNAAVAESAAPLDPATAASVADYAATYALAYEDGLEGTVTFLGDGTLTADFEGEGVTATYSVPEAGKVCFDDVSSGDPPHCWVNASADESGAWVATMDDGSTLTVTPVG